MAKAITLGTLMANNVALPEVLNANYRRGHKCVLLAGTMRLTPD
jgi:hypothetical protein